MRKDLHLASFQKPQQLIFLLILSSTQHALAQYNRPFNYNYNADSSDGSPVGLIVLGIAIFLLIFVVIPLCIVRSRRASFNTTTAAATNNTTTSNSANNNVARTRGRGVDQQVIETFPLINYAAVKHMRASKSPLECAVCLSEFLDDDTLRILPGCRHVFHVNCIDTWLAEHKTCPVCRSNLSDPKVIAGKRLLSLNIEPKDVPISCSDMSEQVASKMDVHQKLNGPRHVQSMNEGWERFTLVLTDEVMKDIKTTDRYRKTVSLQDYTNKGDASRRDGKIQGVLNTFSWKRQGKEESKITVPPPEVSEPSESPNISSRQLLSCPARSDENQMPEIDSSTWTDIELHNLPVHERV